MKCKIHGELAESEIKHGVYRSKKYRKCSHCELERSRKYHAKKYKDEEWVKEKHERDKKRWEEKKAEITLKRQNPESLAKRRAAYKKLAERYRDKCNAKQKEYRETLHDHYVKKIIQNGDKSIRIADIPPGMVMLKRAIMQAKKAIKIQNTLNTGKKVYEIKKC